MDKLNPQQLESWRTFLKTHAKIITLIEQDLASEKRVPLSTYDVLIALYEAPGKRLRINEIGKSVVLSRSGLTRLVDRLERENLIIRERSETDRRGAFAVLTRDGQRELLKAWPVYAKGIQEHFVSKVSNEELELLRTILQKMQFDDEEQEKTPLI
ncbi:MarR family winged helix-turn-helix transcriptional regulator [Brevibacillus sp. SYSU BS000544]|uniref:MarR family winged helix-turn-helix transcriptional regulator n=1 Tax=Brevibacillus sp. SYSU BS000544 TaxID=3416443 RepID=UPI003CE4F1A7